MEMKRTLDRHGLGREFVEVGTVRGSFGGAERERPGLLGVVQDVDLGFERYALD